jgi:hypothetical protein
LAELNAVWYVIHYTSWPPIIHCDCQYVVDAVSYLCENHNDESPFPDNFRILESIRYNLHTLPNRVTTVKVKGHAKFTPEVMDKLCSGEIDVVDILANHAVDILAVAGSKMHCWDEQDTDRYVRNVRSGVNQLVKMLRMLRHLCTLLEELGIYTRDVIKPRKPLKEHQTKVESGIFHGPGLATHEVILPDDFYPRQRSLRWKNAPDLIYTIVNNSFPNT